MKLDDIFYTVRLCYFRIKQTFPNGSEKILCRKRIILFLVCIFICVSVQYSCTNQKPSQISSQSVSQKGNTILFAGDSIMSGLGPVLAKQFSGKYTCIQAGKVSSGLCNTAFYNWFIVLDELMKEHHPDFVIICIGTNDSKSLKYNGNTYQFHEPGWVNAYTAKIQEINAIIRKYHAQAIWLTPPVMGRENLFANVYLIGKIIQRSCEKDSIPVLNTWFILSDHRGRFLTEKEINGVPVQIRYKDKVHITAAGNRLFAEQTFAFLKKYIP